MHKAFQFRIYPTKEQATLINKSIGSSRFVFNHFLTKWKDTYTETGKGLTYNTCAKLLTSLKKVGMVKGSRCSCPTVIAWSSR